jgi:2,4-dienoyl-CoA reductase-like NADH-dependent reductase (Old Yellow Enzyme family)
MPGKPRPLGPSNGFSPMGGRIHGASEADIRRVTEDFATAARLLARAGFDAIELHLGHGYLLSSFLSPRRNKRTDAYGGSVENRARFPREVVRAVREAVGPGVALTAKLNMADGVPGGTWLDTSVETARLLASDGALDALQLTGGSSLENPMYLFRGEVPRAEFAATLPPLLRLGFRLVGRRFLVEYPFEEAFFLPYARQFLAALDLPLILLGGIDRLDTIEQALAEGFAFVAMARALLREPELPNRMREGRTRSGLCIHCNKCMPTIYSGTRCVLVDDQSARP